MNNLNNLALTTTNRLLTSTMGHLMDDIYSRLANGGRDRNCKFYYNAGAGGSMLQVMAKTVIGGAVSDLRDIATNEFNSWLNPKKEEDKKIGKEWVAAERKKQEEEAGKYGKLETDGGVIFALDDWGGVCPEALMLGVETDHEITVTQTLADATNFTTSGEARIRKTRSSRTYTMHTKTLVWYDTTALITINSDKNLITTKVQGRDYSRKELVSNGDIKFSVTGQITSGKPDIYPAEEIKKFMQVMQYKGVVKINNMVLDQLGITHIVITDFNISPQQGYKAMQKYSFSAIGLQPETETVITEDTITAIPNQPWVEPEEEKNEWLKMLEDKITGLKSMAADLFSQGTALATGMLDNAL